MAGIVAAYVAFWSAQRRITVENITKERAKWRDQVREIANEIQAAKVDGAESHEFAAGTAYTAFRLPQSMALSCVKIDIL